MKRIYCLLAVVFCLSFGQVWAGAAAAPLGGSFYAGVGVGWSKLTGSVVADSGLKDTSYDLATVETGYSFISGFALTGVFRYARYKVDVAGATKLELYNYVVNGLYYLDIRQRVWAPYIGLGLGVAVGSTDSSLTQSGINAAYQGIVGVAFRVSPEVRVKLAYNVLKTQHLRHVLAHFLLLDITYSFM